MAIYNLPNYKTADGFGMSLNIRRGNPNPLDNSSVWSSYEDALNYAKTSAISYVGQLVTVVDFTAAVMDGETITTPAQAKVDVYKIELGEDGVGTLTKVGAEEAQAAIDELERDFAAMGTTLEAVEESVEEIDGRLGTVETDLGTAKNDITKAKEDIVSNSEAIDAVEADIEQLKTDVATANSTANSNKTKVDALETNVTTNYALKSEVATAKQEAISEALATILGEAGIDEKYDTLKEVADWILADSTSSAQLVAKVEAIEKDYLDSTDRTEIDKAITDLTTYVGTIPTDAASDNVIAYINEVVAGLKIGDYAKASELKALESRVKTLEESFAERVEEVDSRLDGIDSDIESVETRITALENKEITKDDVVGLPEALNGKIDAEEGKRLITTEEAQKLEKLILNPDGSVTTGQQVAAGDVIGLAEWLKTNGATHIEKLSENNLSDALVTKIESAIKEVSINGDTIGAVDGKVDIPLATASAFGVVKLGSEFKLNADGAMEINTLNVNKLTQTTGEYLELNGGSAVGFEA